MFSIHWEGRGRGQVSRGGLYIKGRGKEGLESNGLASLMNICLCLHSDSFCGQVMRDVQGFVHLLNWVHIGLTYSPKMCGLFHTGKLRPSRVPEVLPAGNFRKKFAPGQNEGAEWGRLKKTENRRRKRGRIVSQGWGGTWHHRARSAAKRRDLVASKNTLIEIGSS